MEAHYYTLQTIYDLVKSDPRPHLYLCNPREIIVRQLLGWDVIQAHLNILAAEGFIEIRVLGNYTVRITEMGIQKVRSILPQVA